MKKVLFATTALLATASMASADIKFSGFGRFGIGYEEDRSDTNNNIDDTILISRFRLNLDGDAETDGGVQFSARVRLEANEDSGTGEADAAELSGARFSVIYGGLRVDAGNVSGAFDNLPNRGGNEPGLESFIGQTSAIDYDFLAFSSTGAGANAVFFQYAIGDFAFGASYDQNTTENGNAALSGADQWDISFSYAFNNITAAIAYGETDSSGGGDDPSLLLFTLGADFGDWNVTALVGDDETESTTSDNDGTVWGLSVAYNLGAATTLIAAYGDGSGDDDNQQYGIGATYDLGGGVSLAGGVGNTDDGTDDTVQADFGVVFNF